MKKSFLAFAVVLGASSTFAQDLTSKKGENFLPEAGDWAISINANPLLNYVGNFFGGNGLNVAPTFDFTASNNAIMGKYFVEDGMAYRVGLNIGFGTQTERANTAGAVAGSVVEDTKKTSSSGIFLTGGLEWRKGTTRLQGFYGAEVGFGFGGGSKEVYTYGNTFDFVTLPSLTNAVDGAVDVRENQTKGGISFGIRGFIGAEYFIIPKLSLGGEFGWGLGLATTGESTTLENRINVAGTALEDNSTVTSSKGSAFMLGTDSRSTIFSPSAQMKISFHF
jgi:hypothetical protein